MPKHFSCFVPDDTTEGNDVESILKGWCKHSQLDVIYDSDQFPILEGKELFPLIKNIPCLYFIHIDTEGNVFGAYQNKPITSLNNYMSGDGNFLFTFSRNGLQGVVEKYDCTHAPPGGIWLYEEGTCLYGFNYGFCAHSTDYASSWVFKKNDYYKLLQGRGLNGKCDKGEKFRIERILIVQASK